MADQNNAPELPDRIWAWRFRAGERNEYMQGGWDDKADPRETEYIRKDLARADRAAPEGQGYFGPMGIPHWSSALTPPPASPTDNTALVEDHICELNRAMNGECMTCGSIDQAMAQEQRQADLRHAALASRETPPAAQEPVAWRCKDYAGDWIIYRNKSDADQYQAVTGCLMQPLYASPPPACQQEAVKRLIAMMAEVVPALDITGHNVSLVKDLRATLRALKGGDA